jgi:RimJ/RimL family protein N-acetyltransferase
METLPMIRQLTTDDVEIFRALRLEALQREPEAFAATAEDFASLSHEGLVMRLKHNRVFVVEANEQPVGMMGLMPYGSVKARHRTLLVMVYLRKENRGKGLANQLLNAVLDHASALGYRYIDLAVSAENPSAIALYKRAGFQQYGYQAGALLHDDREIDEVLMTRRLHD